MLTCDRATRVRARLNALIGGLAIALLSQAICAQAQAQSKFPTRPVRLILPFGPGGVAYVMYTGFEGIRNGQPDRQYVAEEADYAVTPDGLRVRIVSRATLFLGDRGVGVAPRATRVVEGLLKKVY